MSEPYRDTTDSLQNVLQRSYDGQQVDKHNSDQKPYDSLWLLMVLQPNMAIYQDWLTAF